MNHAPKARSGFSSTLDGARAARIERAGLESLAGLRHRPDVKVMADPGEPGEQGGRLWLWVCWEPPAGRGDRGEAGERDEVVEALLPVQGVVFFRREGGRWFRAGRRLPGFGQGPPEGIEERGWPLYRVLVPEPIRAEAGGDVALEPRRLRVARDDGPRSASALLVAIEELCGWAESAATLRLQKLRASRSGRRVLVVGSPLPPLTGIARFWGDRVLVPIGFRADPDLPGPMLAEAIGLDDSETALIGPDGQVEVIPDQAFAPLSRASARLMAGVRPEDRVLDAKRGQGGAR